MYFWKYILAKKAGLSQKKCNMALYGLPVLPIAEAFEKTVTGNPISVTDALAQDALSLQVSFTPTQDGTPSIDSEPTTEPYLSKVIPRGNKEYYSLVGGTVRWSQLFDSRKVTTHRGINATFDDGQITLSGISEGSYSNCLGNFPVSIGHKYIIFAKTIANPNNLPFNVTLNNNVSKKIRGNGYEINTASNTTSTASFGFDNLTANADYTGVVVIVTVHDLTEMFGSATIADYAYTLEQSTAGSGIAWLKSYGFFSKDYYPYNPGELISANTSGHKIGSTTYPIDPIDLRGLFKLDVNNKLYCDGDIYPPSGNVERKRGRVDLGTLNWTYFSSTAMFKSNVVEDLKTISGYYKETNLICPRYTAGTTNSQPQNDKEITITINNQELRIMDTAYTDATVFKNSLSGCYVEYDLATPTTESATPYTSPIDVEAGGTEEFIDSRTVPIPVGNETYYASEFEVHGKTGVTVSHGATSSDTPTEYEVEFTSQGTVYGGTVDIVSGVLTVTWGYIASYNSETLTGRWMSSKDVYAEGTTPSTGAEVAYELATPQTYQLTPQQVQMLLNDNYLTTEDGIITITYMAGK